MSDSFAHLDATAQAALVRSGECTSRELVDAAIARAEALHPQLNAIIHPLFQKACDAADRIDAGEGGTGPFRGVPFLVKDAVCQTAGDPYHLGMRFLKERDVHADHDTELARRFRAAGFVFVGKTNTPELAMSVTTEPIAYGATRNPWSTGHSPGGSSGGSAAAVAAGIAPVGHANDMGGSIRLPASFCGLVGLKPTRGRSSLAPDFGEYWGPLTHEHVVTRSVRDCAAVLDAIAGAAPGDPYTAPAPRRPFREELGARPGALRIGFVAQHDHLEVSPTCSDAVRDAAALFEELGHHVREESFPELAQMEMGPWIPAGLARDLDRWSARLGEPIGPEDVEPTNWILAEAGRALDGPAYVASAEAAFAWARGFARAQSARLDVLLTATAPIPPPELGWMAPRVELSRLLARMGQVAALTMPYDLTGQPAISLPFAWDDAGLPIGIQLAAAFGREDTLLRLAAEVEQARPWCDRWPPLNAA